MPTNEPTLPDRLRALADHAARPFAARVENPAFSVDSAALAEARSRLRRTPAPLARPVVVVSGWRAPAMAARFTSARLAALTSHDPRDFIPVSLFDARSIEDAANALIDAVDERFPAPGEDLTHEIDAVAISMGGLASRLAAAPRAHVVGEHLRARRLNIARLFTLATPHRGASLAQVVAPDACAKDMRPGSPFLRRLDNALAAEPLDIIPYARLRDGMVGAQNAAPHHAHPLWIDGPPALAHLAITTDRRIMLDIALRLRGETPVARFGAPPPRQ